MLASIFIAALMADNAFGGVEKRLDDLEAVLAGPGDAMVVRDRAQAERLPALIATHRAGLALVAGDLDGTISNAESALALAGTDDRLTLAAPRALKGLASWAVGDLRSAYEGYTRGSARPRGGRARRRRPGVHGDPRGPGPHARAARRRPASGGRGAGPRPIGDHERSGARDGRHVGRAGARRLAVR